MAFRSTQGTFSYLPPLNDEQIRKQVEYCLQNDWPINIEFTDDPHPRNVYWYDRTVGRQTSAMQFITYRPAEDPGFRLVRQETHDRMIRYTLHSYATDKPSGRRYGG